MKIILFILLFTQAIFADVDRVINVNLELSKPPYAYMEDGSPKGIYVDILKSAFERIGTYSIQFINTPKKIGLRQLKDNDILIYLFDNNISSDNHKISIKTKNGIDFDLLFSDKYFLRKNDFTKSLNLAINVMKHNGAINDIRESYLGSTDKKELLLALYSWGFMVDDGLEEHGLYTEIIREVWKNAGYDINLMLASPHYAYLLTKWGKTLAAGPAISPSSPESDFFYFSNPLFDISVDLFYKRKNFPRGIEKDLDQYKIGAIANYYYLDILKDKSINIVYYDTQEELYRALIDEKIDFIVSNKHIFSASLLIYTNETVEYTIYQGDFLKRQNLCLSFSKHYHNSRYLMEVFNKNLELIKENGKLISILKKYNFYH